LAQGRKDGNIKVDLSLYSTEGGCEGMGRGREERREERRNNRE